MRKTFLLSILLLAAGIGGASAAQAGKDGTPAFVDAFAGNWMTYEPSLAAGGTCQLDLQKTPQGKNYAAGQTSCAGALSGVTAWGIVDQQLALLGADGKVAARLGGNQNRISGTLADGSEVTPNAARSARPSTGSGRRWTASISATAPNARRARRSRRPRRATPASRRRSPCWSSSTPAPSRARTPRWSPS